MKNISLIHPDFKLNGINHSKNSLLNLADHLIKNGEAYEKELAHFILQWFDNNDFINLTTSGTTGTPKQIQLKKQAMIHSALSTADFFGIFAKDKALLCLPTKYIAGKMMFVRAIVLGLDLDFVPPSKSPLDSLSTTYNFVAMVPMQVQNSLHKIHLCKTLIIGGAKLEDNTKKALINIPIQAYETYGMTETITHIAAKKIQEEYFTALPHAKISTDHRSCLIIDAPLVADTIITTNDLVQIYNRTQFKWLGRIDNIINSGGIKIIPEQIEQKLSQHIPFRFFITAKQDAELGQKAVLVIEHTPYQLPKNTFENLEKHQKPKEIIFVQKFEETPTGKIKRIIK